MMDTVFQSTKATCLQLTVDINENERRWVGKGFSKGGLLPTDPGPFSSTDGSLSWKSMKEASDDSRLLGRGWVYKEEEPCFTTTTTQKDDSEKCWMYASDYKIESMNIAKPKGGLLQWVRFHRLSRTKIFLPGEFVPEEIYEKCDHCDSSTIEPLSNLILDVLSYCSLVHNLKHAQHSDVLPLKERLIGLAFSHQIPKEESSDAFNQLKILQQKLENFVKSELSDTVMSRLLNGIDFNFNQRTDKIEFKQRCTEVETRFLPKNERDVIVSLIIRKLDPSYQVHCNKVGCGEECRFALAQCPNEGCSASMSKVHMDAHDDVCPFKIVTCICGETFVRHELAKHQSEECTLRDAKCPFANIGCTEIVKACDINQHNEDNVSSHLLLAVNRMMEYQDEMRSMRDRITALEHENKDLKQSLKNHQQVSASEIGVLRTKANLTTKTIAALEANSKSEVKKMTDKIEKQQKNSTKEIGNLGTKINKTNKTLAALEISSTNEFKKIRGSN